ncbi:YjgN family protein [Gilvimarinus xylanilyticus]|uniref:YjgN family protein n=1 Tax=Gilvimarinus xylanilyticus TaxID=2944139 RepID=A0A9X2HVB7_9GAMM|nr:YjgN family protein [Gilvimarinus xylanilyticus]MCP8899103.1 YjgN family protein [Gilvimarinus xylanilyticus]
MINDNKTYQVILLGALPGVVDVQAQAGFAKLFKLPPEKVERVFAQPRRVLKSGLTLQQAETYVKRLADVGVACEMREQVTPVSEPAAPPPADPSAGAPPAPGDSTNAADVNEPRECPFVFTGNGFEYFKIWIVNILLSIVTLGIYSAWAKVRNKQYFYGNTYLDDVSFAYTADPVKILIGRIIAFVFLVIYTVFSETTIIGALVMGVLLLIFLPWVICKSMRFNARYSQYRNVPFCFHGRAGEAALVFLLWPFLSLFTLGLLFPYAFHQQKKFIYGMHGYGTTEFEFSATVGEFYKVFLLTFGIYVVTVGIAMILGAQTHPVIALMLTMVAYFFSFAYFAVAMANVNYNAITLREHALSADWNLKRYCWLLVSNTLLTIVTLGLFIPWAKVRTAQFKADHTSAVLVGDIDTLVAEERDNVNALAESVGDLFDIEIGL